MATTSFWTRLRRRALLSLLVICGCAGDSTGPVDRCDARPLPFRGAAAAPAIVDAALEVQTHGVVVLITATDPQGSENLRDVPQSVGVFRDRRCEGARIVLQDDIAISGEEESFGTAVNAETDPALYAAIAAARQWPVEVDFRDVDGNRTSGRVLARVFGD